MEILPFNCNIICTHCQVICSFVTCCVKVEILQKQTKLYWTQLDKKYVKRTVCRHYFDWFYYRPLSQESVVVNSRIIGFIYTSFWWRGRGNDCFSSQEFITSDLWDLRFGVICWWYGGNRWIRRFDVHSNTCMVTFHKDSCIIQL